ncbi:MAG: outer membrane beta-barrel protein [Chthoniobacterales bacterium]
MKKIAVAICLVVMLGHGVYGGTTADFPVSAGAASTWYADNEWNVSLWGTYAVTDNDYPTLANATVFFPTFRVHDTYLEADHAWGGGLDARYFFHRYFGVGVQGYLLDVSQSYPDLLLSANPNPSYSRTAQDRQLIGSVSATFTLRYPLGASRFSPYLTAGGGFLFGGGQEPTFFLNPPRSSRTGSTTKAVGQFGAGIEVRLTRHIGLINAASWNVVDGKDNNFGMVLSGLNFAF